MKYRYIYFSTEKRNYKIVYAKGTKEHLQRYAQNTIKSLNIHTAHVLHAANGKIQLTSYEEFQPNSPPPLHGTPRHSH